MASTKNHNVYDEDVTRLAGEIMDTLPFTPTNFVREAAPAVPPRAPSNTPPHSLSSHVRRSAKDMDSATQTTTNTTSSSALSKPAPNLLESDEPAPYGTRSRNRNGNHRPNYAEDRELDLEYDMNVNSTKKGQSSVGQYTGRIQATDETKAMGDNARRTSTTGSSVSATKPVVTTPSKDSIPGMSTFSLHPEVQTMSQPLSKKRKAPGGTTNGGHASLRPTNSSTSTRRASAVVPTAGGTRESNMLTFESCQGYLKNGKLKADDGTILGVNDHVYLICEPPGEPYYLARIMEFLHAENDTKLPIDSLRVNWYYRPRDMQRKVNDTRVVFASMHSDTCPLTSLRGKCRILHRSDIKDMEEYRKTKDSFWYDKMFDRYIHRYYEVIPTSQVINVPEKLKPVLDERWKFVIVEIGRGKELTSAIKSCKRCSGYCAINDSVDCAVCKNTYHMNCVRPPLLKKPQRGFAWSCGPCSRRQERKLEARNTPNMIDRALEGDEEELFDEEEDEHAAVSDSANTSQDALTSGSKPPTADQIAQDKLWPYRYLGIHCRIEDALDYDDRIYPRASSRLGPRHQANVTLWPGRPVELVKPAEIKRKYVKGSSHKKDAKLSKETVAALEADKIQRERRPKWVMDEPLGYVHRGEDHPNSDPLNTAKLQFRLPTVGEASSRGEQISSQPSVLPDQREKIVDDYMTRAKGLAKAVGVEPYCTNFLDKALELLCSHDYKAEPALEQLRHVNRRKDLKIVEFTKEEFKRFEEGVTRYGSELQNVSRHVGKSVKHAEIVRFYYTWKKTGRGKQIWGHYEGRKGKKQAKQLDTKLVDDVADDIDDSAFDNDKAAARRRGFECKFCATRKSKQWRRAPGTVPGTAVLADKGVKHSKDKGAQLFVALCQRCAGLWRKYGIQWENIDEVAKKVAQGGGRAWKRRIDEELLIELASANEANAIGMSSTAAAAAASVGVDIPMNLTIQPGQECPKKKQKVSHEKDLYQPTPVESKIEPPKKKVVEKPPEPPLIPEQPKLKVMPCAVCTEMEPMGEQHLCCRICMLTVHRNCYGITDDRPAAKWTCDMCLNDTNSLVSYTYNCRLCPVDQMYPFELFEPPKVSHKKKTDREREKERLEREMVDQETEVRRRKQEEAGRPIEPREALKRTKANNWVHVVCAVWTPEIKFRQADALDLAEGLSVIPEARYLQTCKLCKSNERGACVTCHQCSATFHVGCAAQCGYLFGFDVTPVKGSRKDVVNTVTLGSEVGNVNAVIYCREHTVESIVHPMNESIENGGLNALQVFVRNYKRITSVSGALINSKNSALLAANGSGTATSSASNARSSRISPTPATITSEEVDQDGDRIVHLSDVTVAEISSKTCAKCGIGTSPKWHSIAPVIDIKTTSPHLDRFQDRSTTFSQNANTTVNGKFRTDDHMYPNALVLPAQYDIHSEPLPDSKSDIVYETTKPNLEPTLPASSPENVAQESRESVHPPAFQCHKCFLKKTRQPTPLPSPTPQPEPIDLEAETLPEPEHNVPTSEAWPPVLAVPEPSPYLGWPSQSVQPTNGLVHMRNEVSRSPPPPNFSRVNQHLYAPHSPQYQAPLYGHAHQHLGPPVQHQINGAHHPYQAHRHSVGHSVMLPYPQHGGHSQHPSQLSNGTRPPPPRPRQRSHSPLMHHDFIQGPHGPPRAAENPFATPNQSQSSPRTQYDEFYDPHAIFNRPHTPLDSMGRNGGWLGNDGQLNNGASASPSLRNLLR